MRPEKTRSKLFTRRAAFLLGGKALLMAGLGSRLYYLQVLESERYQVMAEENRINWRLLAPPRGFIADRNGDYVAINVQNYRVLLVPEQAKAAASMDEVLDRLAKLIDFDEHDRKRVLREAARKRAFVPITVRENLSWPEVSRLGVNAPDLPGINIDVGETRHYPYGANMAHVLGYVAAVSEKELTGDPLLELPGFKIGKNGIEREYDLALRGAAGSSQVEVNALGRIIRELKRQEGTRGKEVRLTLDMTLQDFVGERLSQERAASAVVMDVHSGEVLALVSTPSYDPNAFSEGIGAEEWHSLVTNPYGPLTNKAIAGQYAPGSTFKIVVALAALEQGIAPDHRVFCNGHMQLGDRKFHCWKKHGHGQMELVDALRESCDVWFYDVARRIGVDKIAEVARRLGLGDQTGISLNGEKTGLIPTKQWKREARGQPWHLGESLIVGIGQGYVLATPLQLALMTARLVNGGKAVTPKLAPEWHEGGGGPPGSIENAESLKMNPAHIATVMEGLDQVVNHHRGTARASALRHETIAMAGKTGTSQVRRISQAERDTGIRKGEDIAWRLRDHALFVGYAPADNPRFAVSVVVEHGGGGSKAAAPIARDVLDETLRLAPNWRTTEGEATGAIDGGEDEGAG